MSRVMKRLRLTLMVLMPLALLFILVAGAFGFVAYELVSILYS